MSPLRIQAEKSLVKKIAIGALAVLGGGAFAYVGKLRLYFFVGDRWPLSIYCRDLHGAYLFNNTVHDLDFPIVKV
jgi:hypothetical protein